MSEQLWCPTRGYFVIGAGAGAPAGEAPSEDASPSAAEETSAAVSVSSGPTAAGASGQSGGSQVWAPTRGYFTITGGAPAGGSSAAPKPAPAKKAPPSAPAAGTEAAAAPAAPKPKVATAPAAAKKAAPERAPKEAAAPLKAAPADPELVSVTRVPPLAEVSAFRDVAKTVYDEPDSETKLYRVTTLNVAFAISSLLLLVTILAVLWQDYDRSWKQIQKDFRGELLSSYRENLYEKSAESFDELAALEPPLLDMIGKLGAAQPSLPSIPADSDPNAAGEIDYRRFRAEGRRIEALLAAIHAALDRDPEYGKLGQVAIDTANDLKIADLKLRHEKAKKQSRVSYIQLEKEAIIAKYGTTSRALEELERTNEEYASEWDVLVEKLGRELESATLRSAEAKAALQSYEDEKTRIEGENIVTLASIHATVTELEHPISLTEDQITGIEGSLSNKLRDAVLLDALRPTVSIQKVVIDEIKEDLNFLQVPRVDRCKTCHINIDIVEPRFDDLESHEWGSVYQPHPRPDLYLQDTSPHGYLQFGCTGCHYGDGRATDFVIAAHMPDDEEQEREWEERFHWHEKHHQVQPMRREKHLTGGCRKCHSEQDHLDGADTLNLGLATVREYGCFGCHRIDNFEVMVGAPETDADLWKRHKVGPSLRYIADKVDSEFLYKWIRDPQHFRPSTRMPHFFDLTNTSGDMHIVRPDESVAVLDFEARNGVETLALATYLHETSGSRRLPVPAVEGDPARGREAFSSLGCLGCHSVKVESVAPSTPSLAELREAAPRLAQAFREKANAPATAAARSDQALLAARYGEIAAGLVEMAHWFEKLLPNRDLEQLYVAIRTPVARARTIEERLGVAESHLDEADALASAFYDHWAHNTFAPDLSGIGSKFETASASGRERAVAWLTDWILDPSRHHPETVMPRFRLDQDEEGEQRVADIVAYLLTLRNPEFEESEALTPATLDEASRGILRDIVFDNLRANHSTTEAEELAASMTIDRQLLYVGHRLVRRYGCFGCHNGIADIDPDPTAAQLADGAEVPTFDRAQPIGTELSSWGDKDVNRLDYGPWGHQPDGSHAIAHDRKDWLAAKLSDTRRFDVFPARKWIDREEGEYVYLPTHQLIQKKPDELLKMPLFPFHDEPEVVDAVVTFITGLVNDRVEAPRRRELDAEEQEIELGGRLIRRYNCAGCHRIGVDPETVALKDLPTFNDVHEEDTRRAEWQKETWLARSFEVIRPLPSTRNATASRILPKGMLLNIGVLDPQVPSDAPRASTVDPVNVVQLVHRHYDPLPGFVQAVLRSLDEYADLELVDPDLHAFVTKTVADSPDANRFAAFLARARKAAFEETDTPYGAMLARLFDRPYDPDAVAWLDSSAGQGEVWAELAKEFYGRPLPRISPDNQRLAVRGLGEGAIRYYFGTSAEHRSNAPPPLVREGERVRADWLFHFLLDVHPIRPWLKVRMPSFGFTQNEARAIVAWFRATSDLPRANEVFAADRLVASEAEQGHALFQQTFTCFKCHIVGEKLPELPLLTVTHGIAPEEIPISAPSDSYYLAFRDEAGRVRTRAGFADDASAQAEGEKLPGGTDWAVGPPWNKASWGPDLSMASVRLRPEWLFRWLMSPKDFMPGTKMPNFFGDRERYAGEWDGHLQSDQREQIQALIQYLVHMGELDTTEAAPLGGGGN